jgi:hypothetical protein
MQKAKKRPQRKPDLIQAFIRDAGYEVLMFMQTSVNALKGKNHAIIKLLLDVGAISFSHRPGNRCGGGFLADRFWRSGVDQSSPIVAPAGFCCLSPGNAGPADLDRSIWLGSG